MKRKIKLMIKIEDKKFFFYQFKEVEIKKGKRFKDRSSGYFIHGRSKDDGYFLGGRGVKKNREKFLSVLLRPKKINL